MDTGRQSGGGRTVATFYDLCSEIWSGSPVTESIQAGLEDVESFKTSLDEDINPLEKVAKDNHHKELEEEEDNGDEASTVASATSGISSVSPIQQNLLSTSTTIQQVSSETSNKTLRGQTSQKENGRNIGKSQKWNNSKKTTTNLKIQIPIQI